MAVRVFFVGNIFGGDDGIGPRLYQELKNDRRLVDMDLQELGVIGFDMLSYARDGDHIIIVDAVRQDGPAGRVVCMSAKDLRPNFRAVSMHDFGVEETAAIVSAHMPKTRLDLVGVTVPETRAFSDRLSDELMSRLSIIRDEVAESILGLVS